MTSQTGLNRFELVSVFKHIQYKSNKIPNFIFKYNLFFKDFILFSKIKFIFKRFYFIFKNKIYFSKILFNFQK